MTRFNTERMLGVAVALFVLTVAAAIVIGTVALNKAVDVNRQVQDPTVKESRVRISRSIGRYTKPQLRRLLKRLLSVATPAQVRDVDRIRDAIKRRRPAGTRQIPVSDQQPRRRPASPPPSPAVPKPNATPKPSLAPQPPQATSPAAPAETAAPATPRPIIKTDLPLVPLQVCTGLLAVNCS